MIDNNLKLMGKRIRDLRTKAGLSQEKLAELSSISSRHISEIERGESNPSFQVLSRIAASLDVPLLALLDFQHKKDVEDIEADLIALLKKLPTSKLQTVYRVVSILAE